MVSGICDRRWLVALDSISTVDSVIACSLKSLGMETFL
jgi:hypothetical protein